MEANGGGGFQSLLDQLRRTSNQEARSNNQAQKQSHQPPHPTDDLLAQFTSYHQANQSQYYEQSQEGPYSLPPFHHSHAASGVMESQMPSAPTPPASGFPNAQFPPGIMGAMGFGRQQAQPQYGMSSSYTHDRSEINERSNSERQGNLLSLLKFSGSSSASQPPVEQQHHHYSSSPHEEAPREIIHAPAPGPSDPTGLLAALMKGNVRDDPPHHEPTVPQPAPAPPVPQPWASTATSAESQQYLLNLLNRPKPSQNEPSYTAADAPQQSSLTPQSLTEAANEPARESTHESSPFEQYSEHGAPQETQVPMGTFDFESPKPKYDGPAEASGAGATRTSMFNYSNPFEDLAASSPLNRTPKTSTTPGASASSVPGAGQTATLPIQILKKPAAAPGSSGSPAGGSDHKRLGADRSPLSTPEHSRRKLNDAAESTPVVITVTPDPEEQQKETVADAVSDLARIAHKEAQEALARAEHEHAQAEIARDLAEMNHAKSERDFEESAHIAAQAIKKELDKEGNNSVLEDTLPADLALAVREIVEEAAATPGPGAVADSWESAEADEVVVVEESEDPIKVYNFPMKPWISITVQETEEDTRPTFRDEAIIDIARLKKDFDQVDRNLVTASESYMTYGMSKAGGLRVIRQMDGKDAKLFTDTKDRIFNLALSSTPASDQSAIHKECIIGTGISGTVYWVQIRDGEKDHLDDANPEQYGFALPPITSAEGDAPGGVLKTRARTSTTHPEYFAVGRGKSINIVWPGFIMQHGLFKPGHDRVVDTDRLAKQCSLKINTGKAGKDFTFSQDDTTVVSLDKSGRVKFWDVRDLTAATEDSDGRLPAHTSLEVKEPLLTLTTMPEGEKAWPTSVLLLDKLRPYQKRGALRYMVVGMKQNHTLQLWDLALGKPVQEFHLPHSKESDAVCSVMYHPPTGMIVVGHPTRNSVYLLHLSAPKYSMKNMSQVDYILRLNAQDSSIPQPESTAVISGLREYSFSNKGVLRSLDILQTPTSSTEGDDQALFELYGMHSKGVTCVVIKQAELGWSRENKVMAPVPAVESGIVKIEVLRSLAPPVETTHHSSHHNHSNNNHAEEPVVKAIMSRGAKDLLQSAPTSQDDSTVTPHKGSSGPPKSKDHRDKDKVQNDEGAAQPPPPAYEKVEKKSRKKKTAASTAAAASSLPESQQGLSNGSHSPKVGPTKPDKTTGSSALVPSSAYSVPSQPPFGQIQDSIDTRVGTMEGRLKAHLTQEIQNASPVEVVKKVEASLAKREVEFENKFKTLLDMISSVLTDNTQDVLNQSISKGFKNTLLPALRDDVAKSISEQVTSKIHGHVGKAVQMEVAKSLPSSVAAALKQQDLINAISDNLAKTVGRNVEDVFMHSITSHVLPNFTAVAAQTTQQVANDILRQVNEELGRVDQKQRADAAKIDELMATVTRLAETVNTMAISQNQFQTEFLKTQAPPSVVHQQHVTHQLQIEPAPQHQQHQAPHQYPPMQHHQQRQPLSQYGSQVGSQLQTPLRHTQSLMSHSQHSQHSAVSGRGAPVGRAGSYNSPGSGSNTMVSPPHSIGLGHAPPAAPAPTAGPFSTGGGGGSTVGSAIGSSTQYASPGNVREKAELEQLVAQVDALMGSGNHDEAMMKWLQGSPYEQEVFGRVLKKYNPDFIRSLQPLVLLSVGATVSNDIEGPVLREKLAWIEMVLLNFHQMLPNLDSEILSITPKILELIKTRIETIFMRISNTQANDASLKNLAQMIQLITRMIAQVKPRLAPSY